MLTALLKVDFVSRGLYHRYLNSSKYMLITQLNMAVLL
jgi:hypothetical protein